MSLKCPLFPLSLSPMMCHIYTPRCHPSGLPSGLPSTLPSTVYPPFSAHVWQAFLDTNGLSMVVRSHEVKDEGYLVEHDERLVTVFSAPNYCDQMGNKGAIAKFDIDCKPTYVQFEAVPHPNIKPMAYANNMSMFGF